MFITLFQIDGYYRRTFSSLSIFNILDRIYTNTNQNNKCKMAQGVLHIIVIVNCILYFYEFAEQYRYHNEVFSYSPHKHHICYVMYY